MNNKRRPCVVSGWFCKNAAALAACLRAAVEGGVRRCGPADPEVDRPHRFVLSRQEELEQAWAEIDRLRARAVQVETCMVQTEFDRKAMRELALMRKEELEKLEAALARVTVERDIAITALESMHWYSCSACDDNRAVVHEAIEKCRAAREAGKEK